MCRTDYGKEGEWLFGKFSIADAMYAPVALRFAGYSIPLTGLEASYVQSVLDHSNIIEWIEAAMQEQEDDTLRRTKTAVGFRSAQS